MSITKELGIRIELVSMDPHFHEITIGLYRQNPASGPQYLVHSYSGLDGTTQRIESFRRFMVALGQMDHAGDCLRMACGSAHQAAVKRTFLEAAKLTPDAAPAPKPLTILDKKSGRNFTATSLGGGRYQVTADGPEDGKAARVDSVTAGLAKLGELEVSAENPGQVAFACGSSHDALIGLLLPRALNVRAALREEEASGGRGLLVAPSQQK